MKALQANFRKAPLAPPDRVMLEFAEKLTRTPSSMSRDDVEKLRQSGFGDEAILEIVQITGYFNYINRVADGLGIDPEPEWQNTVT